jgi:hypothetical protein
LCEQVAIARHQRGDIVLVLGIEGLERVGEIKSGLCLLRGVAGSPQIGLELLP